MARCPHCNHILDDAWLKHQGASLMGRSGGPAKSRSAVIAKANALKRLENKRKRKRKLD